MSTLPKPFVFVLMPFEAAFADIYKFGIKGAAEEVGAYAQRLDEQIFTEGILERIFSQISKADVIVADMTGRNPNVFYEVGYAHALNKVVLLLTQNADDIPFDLKHRQHTVYGGSIESLKAQLIPKLEWALAEARSAPPSFHDRLLLKVGSTPIPAGPPAGELPLVAASTTATSFRLPIQIRNLSPETSVPINYVYLFTRMNPDLVPYEDTGWNFGSGFTSVKLLGASATLTGGPAQLDYFHASSEDSPDAPARQYRLRIALPAIPPGAVELETLNLIRRTDVSTANERFRIRLHTGHRYLDFPFRLTIEFKEPDPTATDTQSPA